MEYKDFILLNFAYGYGPFIKSVKAAFEVNDLFEKRGMRRKGIIVPLVYGDRQKSIIEENFGDYLSKYPDEILFDETLGGFLSEIFYEGESYIKYLKDFLKTCGFIEREIEKYFSGAIKLFDMNRRNVFIERKNIIMEIARSPRISFGISPSYYFGFGFISEIFSRFVEEFSELSNPDKNILREAADFHKKVEEKYDMCFLAEPGTLSEKNMKKEKISGEKNIYYTPPHLDDSSESEKTNNFGNVEKGIYVTVSGIPNLYKLFKNLPDLNLKIYTNRSDVISFGEKASPKIMKSDKILFHFARSGMGSVWRSQITGTPLLVPEYDKGDDPEIYFNNKMIEKLGIGMVYRKDGCEKIFSFRENYLKNVKLLNNFLLKKYGTLDGTNYLSERISNHFLKYAENK